MLAKLSVYTIIERAKYTLQKRVQMTQNNEPGNSSSDESKPGNQITWPEVVCLLGVWLIGGVTIICVALGGYANPNHAVTPAAFWLGMGMVTVSFLLLFRGLIIHTVKAILEEL